MERLAPGLSYWTAYHPEWKEEVVSYALETDDGLVLFDPLGRSSRRRPEHVVLTLYYHARSTAELSPKRVWAPHRSVRPLEHRGIAVKRRAPRRPARTPAPRPCATAPRAERRRRSSPRSRR